MKTETVLMIAVLGAVAVGGYVLYKKSQEQRPVTQVAANNPNDRNQLADTIDSVSNAAHGVLDLIENQLGGY